MHWQLESMETRRLLTIVAAIDPQTGLLSINGDGADNVIVVSRNAAGTILVNAGAIPVLFGPATVHKHNPRSTSAALPATTTSASTSPTASCRART